MGPTGSNEEIVDLARSLEDDGCSVHTFDSMPVEVTMTKFDMAVLVVTEHDPLSLESTDHRIQRILHAAGFLEARLAPDRVCLLVEDAVSELQAPPVTQIRYPTGNPAAGKGELIKFIQAQYPRVHRDLHRQVPIREQAQSDELRVPWAMLIAVGLAALIPIVLLARTLTNGDDAETETIDISESADGNDVAGPEAGDESSVDSATAESDGAGNGSSDSGALLGESQDGSGGDGEATAGSGGGNTSTGGASDDDGNDNNSTSPTLTPRDDGGTDGSTSSTQPDSDVRLPSTCVIDVRKSLAVPSTIECNSGGRLVLEGFEGPWHNEISEVAVATGTTGTLFYEPGLGLTELPLQAGNIMLDQAAARYGVNTISVTFSADGQHIHLFQADDRGGAKATLIFTLD